MKINFIRLLDILISILLLINLLPILIITSLLILILNGKPIIYRQIRVGIKGKKIQVFKFRTMKNKLYKNEILRLTKLGSILRRLSLDEVPQLINVLKKEMSLVGPRPLPLSIEKKINKKLRDKRRKVLPGITGLSQIEYTGEYRKLSEKVSLDIKFVENYSLLNYLKILWLTPFTLIIRLLKNKTSIIK